MKKILSILSLLLITLSACSTQTFESADLLKPQLTIVVAQETPPPTCQIHPRESISISLKGTMPEDSYVNWRSRGGGEFANDTRITTIYTAPEQPSNNPIEIIATIFNIKTGPVEVHQECEVVSQDNVPPIIPTATEIIVPATPIVSVTPTTTTVPTPTMSPVPAAPGLIAITEIMANPCGKQDEELANEYIELYNYSDQPVDLAGVFMIASNQEQNDHPDQLVAWKTRNSVPDAFANLITDSTILQPKSFALIMEPNYHLINSSSIMPYNIPPGTLILTLSKKNRLGNAVGGLISSGNGSRDSIYLFTGSANRVEKIISTYAILNAGPYPYVISIPFQLPVEAGDCQAVMRKTVPGEDKSVNWTFGESSPGSGPY